MLFFPELLGSIIFLFSFLRILVCKLCAEWLFCSETIVSFPLSSQSQFSWEHYLILNKMSLPKLLVFKIYFSSSSLILSGEGHMHCYDYTRNSHNWDWWSSMPWKAGVKPNFILFCFILFIYFLIYFVF